MKRTGGATIKDKLNEKEREREREKAKRIIIIAMYNYNYNFIAIFIAFLSSENFFKIEIFTNFIYVSCKILCTEKRDRIVILNQIK